MQEMIQYHGKIYKRSPDSSVYAARVYYRRKQYSSRERRVVWVFLHRKIWEDTHGCSVPAGYVVIHLDGDCSNNAPDNLDAVPYRESKRRLRKYRNIQERPCDRCGDMFPAKTIRSRFCEECMAIVSRSKKEREVWYGNREN